MSTPFPSPWPADFQGCVLKGAFRYLDGTPVTGTITLQATPNALIDATSPMKITTKVLTITLRNDGFIYGWDGQGDTEGVLVPATDDPDINPMEWTYTVNENWTGGTKGYSIKAPQGTTVDLVTASPVPSSNGQAIYRGPAGIPLGSVAPPTSATSAGTEGQMAYDSGFLYVCVATNSWKRVALAAW